MSVEIMAVAEQQVMDQLRTVNDPELQQDLVALNMIKKVVISGDRVKIHVELTTPACPLKETIHRDVVEAVRRVPGVQQVDLEWSSRVQPHRSAAQRPRRCR